MSIIDGVGPASIGRPPSRGRPEGAARFTIGPVAGPARGATAEAAAPVIAAGMLALQEVGEETVQDRLARRHGRALLTALARLQHQLLGAADPEDALDALASLADGLPRSTDAALAAALDGVRLRARVELARRGR